METISPVLQSLRWDSMRILDALGRLKGKEHLNIVLHRSGIYTVDAAAISAAQSMVKAELVETTRPISWEPTSPSYPTPLIGLTGKGRVAYGDLLALRQPHEWGDHYGAWGGSSSVGDSYLVQVSQNCRRCGKHSLIRYYAGGGETRCGFMQHLETECYPFDVLLHRLEASMGP